MYDTYQSYYSMDPIKVDGKTYAVFYNTACFSISVSSHHLTRTAGEVVSPNNI